MMFSKSMLVSYSLFFSLLITMQWITSEKWWSGVLIFAVLSLVIVRRVVNRHSDNLNNLINESDKKKILKQALKMWIIAQGHFLGVALVYYLGLTLIVAISQMELPLGSVGVMGVYFLTKVVGLAIANVLFVPVVCIVSLIAIKFRAADKQINQAAA